MENAPFKVGDEVVFNVKYVGALSYLNDVVRKVTAVRPSRICTSGWAVSVDGPNARNPNGGLANNDSRWFTRPGRSKPQTLEGARRDQILDKIKQGIGQGLSDQDIDKSFQRHVTKAELVGLIRQHLLKGN